MVEIPHAALITNCIISDMQKVKLIMTVPSEISSQFHVVWWRSIVSRTLVSASGLFLCCARLLAGWVTTLWLSRPLSVSQHGQLSLPSLRGRLMSSNLCYSGLRRQTAEGVVRGVAYRPRQRVLLAARLECRLVAGSRPRNGDEHRSLRCRQ